MRLNHPVSMSLCLIMYTVVIATASGLIRGRVWFSYILVLVFLGGVLVLFIYITRLASNDKFVLNFTDFLSVPTFILILLGGVLISIVPSILNVPPSLDFVQTYRRLVVCVAKLYNTQTYKFTIYLVFYLLLALLVCVNLVGVKTGGLRSFN
jgi:NADH-ubiquinone oxidoreductase chain 6